MYIGHYGLALIAGRKFKKIPLWQLFVSVQFLDLLAFSLILLGVERIYSIDDPNPYYRTVLEYLPYSHSLISSFIIALLVLAFLGKLKSKETGLILSIGVFSHWFLDFPFQKNNMPIVFNDYKAGLGLWDYALFSYSFEIVFIIITGYYFYKTGDRRIKGIGLFLLVVFMIAYFSFVTFGVPSPVVKDNPSIKVIAILIPYLLFTFLAYRIEASNRIKPEDEYKNRK